MNLAASLAVLEFKTLVIDADPQANTTSGLGHDPREIDKSIYECMVDGIDIYTIIIKTEMENLHLIPSHIDLVGAEVEMVNLENREEKMRNVVSAIKEDYDFIIIDCPDGQAMFTFVHFGVQFPTLNPADLINNGFSKGYGSTTWGIFFFCMMDFFHAHFIIRLAIHYLCQKSIELKKNINPNTIIGGIKKSSSLG